MEETDAAHIVERNRRRYWLCPGCQATLGEVTAERVFIKIRDRFVRIAPHADVEQVCPRCHTVSHYQCDSIATMSPPAAGPS